MKKGIFSSPQTTWYGILNFLAVATTELSKLVDEDLYSTPDWGLIVAGLLLMLGLMKARDNDKSSEKVGIKETPAG